MINHSQVSTPNSIIYPLIPQDSGLSKDLLAFINLHKGLTTKIWRSRGEDNLFSNRVVLYICTVCSSCKLYRCYIEVFTSASLTIKITFIEGAKITSVK